MQKIIICGYPKSGNTWLTRLTAELANCPVKGFLYSDHTEIAEEGKERLSQFECYKSHHQWHEIKQDDLTNSKIIYIVRDPRDIVLSGSSYFQRNFWKLDLTRSKPIILLQKSINKLYRIFIGNKKWENEMIKAILDGNAYVHNWCRISWKTHLTPFLNSDKVLLLKYEDLLATPYTEAEKIIHYLDIKMSPEQLKIGVDKQSFKSLKEKYKKEGDKNNNKFLRKGTSQQWKTKFNSKTKELFIESINQELVQLNYPAE